MSRHEIRRVDLDELKLIAQLVEDLEDPRIDHSTIRAAITELRDLRARMERAPLKYVRATNGALLPKYFIAAPPELHTKRVRLVVCDE